MHPFPAVPDSRPSRRAVRASKPRRHWPRRASLALVCTFVLVAVPLALGPTTVQPHIPDAFELAASRDGAVSSRSGGRTSGSPTAAAPVASEPASDPVDAGPTMVEEIVTRTNEERAAAGLPALAVSECAAQQAVARTALLAAEDRFEHDPLEPVLEACAVRAVGENLALGYPTALAVVAGWMGSEGHRSNILSAKYTQIGVGCTEGPRGILCAQVFVA